MTPRLSDTSQGVCVWEKSSLEDPDLRVVDPSRGLNPVYFQIFVLVSSCFFSPKPNREVLFTVKTYDDVKPVFNCTNI